MFFWNCLFFLICCLSIDTVSESLSIAEQEYRLSNDAIYCESVIFNAPENNAPSMNDEDAILLKSISLPMSAKAAPELIIVHMFSENLRLSKDTLINDESSLSEAPFDF